jgi:hypothetical protein
VTAVLILVRHISVIVDCIIILFHYLVLIGQVNVEFASRVQCYIQFFLLPHWVQVLYVILKELSLPFLCRSYAVELHVHSGIYSMSLLSLWYQNVKPLVLCCRQHTLLQDTDNMIQ